MSIISWKVYVNLDLFVNWSFISSQSFGMIPLERVFRGVAEKCYGVCRWLVTQEIQDTHRHAAACVKYMEACACHIAFPFQPHHHPTNHAYSLQLQIIHKKKNTSHHYPTGLRRADSPPERCNSNNPTHSNEKSKPKTSTEPKTDIHCNSHRHQKVTCWPWQTTCCIPNTATTYKTDVVYKSW